MMMHIRDRDKSVTNLLAKQTMDFVHCIHYYVNVVKLKVRRTRYGHFQCGMRACSKRAPLGYCFEFPYANVAKAPQVFERKTRDY